MPSGIYKIVNKITNKIYIGSADHLHRRFSEHKNCLNSNKHKNKYLQSSWNLHGEEAFVFEVVELVEDNYKLVEREQYWIDSVDCIIPKGYNINFSASSSLGIKRSAEFKEKCRLAHLGLKHSEETKKKISETRKGMMQSEESKEKIRASKFHNFVNQDRWGTKYNIQNRKWPCPEGQKCKCHPCRTRKSDYVRKFRERKQLEQKK